MYLKASTGIKISTFLEKNGGMRLWITKWTFNVVDHAGGLIHVLLNFGSREKIIVRLLTLQPYPYHYDSPMWASGASLYHFTDNNWLNLLIKNPVKNLFQKTDKRHTALNSFLTCLCTRCQRYQVLHPNMTTERGENFFQIYLKVDFNNIVALNLITFRS